MTWVPIPPSTEVQVDWSQTIARSCVDPYLVWADATRFAGYEPAAGCAIPISLEVRLPCVMKPSTIDGLRRRSVEVASGGASSYRTTTIPKRLIKLLLAPGVQACIPRFEYGAAQRVPRAAVRDLVTKPLSLGQLTKPIVAVIDDGCPFAHAQFRQWDTGRSKWRTRIRLLWDQDAGVFHMTGSDLDAIIGRHTTGAGVVDEAGCYAEVASQMRRHDPKIAARYLRRMNALASHGAHVLDVAAGRYNPLTGVGCGGRAIDKAGECDIAFVQLPRSAVADTSGAAMNVAVLDALAFLSRQLGSEVVVNLSYGALAGPHDGHSILEEALDAMLAAGQFRAVVLPAGNAYEARTHGAVHVDPGRRQTLRLGVLPADPTDTFVELWYDAVQDGAPVSLSIEVRSPVGSSASGAAPLDSALVDDAQQPTAGLIHLRRPTAGSGKCMGLVAIAPTGRNDAGRRNAAHGIWEIDVLNRGTKPVRVDAWVERDDSAFGSGRSRSQARFLSAGIGSAPGHPHAASWPIERTRTLNSFAHGKQVTVVGGVRADDDTLAEYSASGPGRKGPAPGPDLVAPCDQGVSRLGLLAGGNRSSAPTRMDGTSVAAAAVTRAIANGLANGTIGGGTPPKDQLAATPLPSPRLPPRHPTPQPPGYRSGKGRVC